MEDKMPYLVASAIVACSFLVGFLLQIVVLRGLARWAQRTKRQGDDIIIGIIRGPLLFWSVLFGLFFGLQSLTLPGRYNILINKFLLVLAIFSVTLVLANVLVRFITFYGTKPGATVPVTGLTQNLIRIAILTLGILVIFDALEIRITPLLGALGIGGLAVALALQDTLANLFSGFYLTVAKQIKVGDYIKLQSGEEGYVEDITWRATKIRMLPNNIVLIPNSKLSQAVVTNYCLPAKDLAVLVQVGVHYGSDLEKVEKVTVEVAEEVMKTVKGGVVGFKPFIRYHTFDDFSINFSVIMRANEFVENYLIKHEFIKRLHKRYQKEGIVIPYPIWAVNYRQEKAEA